MVIRLSRVSPAGRFVPAGSVLIDAGPGDNNQVDVFGISPIEEKEKGVGT